jgi:hypothetical protein
MSASAADANTNTTQSYNCNHNSTTPEVLSLDAEQQAAYDSAWIALQAPSQHLVVAAVPTVVSVSLDTTSNHTNSVFNGNELFRQLEALENLEKEESSLLEQSPLTSYLTSIATQSTYHDSQAALSDLTALSQAVPRRVCQHPFRKNDIVWVCRTCQSDETCVLCHACFSQSSHENHDVAFYHAQAGGCCDCGDPDGTVSASLYVCVLVKLY